MIVDYVGEPNEYGIRLYPYPQKFQFPNADVYREIVIYEDGKLQHREMHWRFNNIIVWLRLTHRKDVEDREMILIEEIQSDWSQRKDFPYRDKWLSMGLDRAIDYAHKHKARRLGWITSEAIKERFDLETNHPSIRHVYDRDIKEYLRDRGLIGLVDINISRHGLRAQSVNYLEL